VDFVILGRTALHADGRPVDLGAAKQRALLAMLLFHVRVPVRTDTLLHELWGDQPTPRSNLYALVSRTRRVLDGVGLPDALVRVDSGGGYRLDLDPALIDFHRFRRLVASARDAVPAEAAALLVEAIGSWRGEPLADLRGPHAEQLRNHMHDELVDAHKLLADIQLTLGQPHEVLTRLEPFVLDRELDEALADQWMRALSATGRVDDARAFYIQFRKRFRRQVRSDPRVTMPTAPGDRHVPPSASPVPHQLPLDIRGFTGHDGLLRALDDATGRDPAGANVVVLSGMPGVGKTTLAVHWAHRNRGRFPDGQFYLNANAFGTGPDVEPFRALGRFLAALGLAADTVPGDLDGRRDLWNDLLADRQVVLVLDNVRTTEQVRPLIPTTGPCVTLVTSRNRLRGLSIREGARCLTVPPLPTADSATLLTAAIGAARASAEPDGVRELVRLTGGLPLALRIVGEHVAERAQVPVADLAEEFSGHLLGSDGDDEEARLETVIGWSFDALEPADARLFRLLGLFPGATVSAEAVAAMAGEPPPTVHARLRGLARAHLISHDTIGRFRMHDLLRRYATERADEEPAECRRAAVRRLLDWYVWSMVDAARILAPDCPRVPDLIAPHGVTPQTFDTDAAAVAWCGAERANIGPVTRLAIENGWYRPAWQLVGTAHELYDRYGRQDDVLEFCALGLTAARLDGHHDAEMGTLVNQASTFFAMRDHDRAMESLTAALRLARESDDPDAQTICLHNLGSVHLATGRTTAAIAAFTEVLAMCRRTGNTVGESSTLHRLGTTCRRMGRYREAATYYADALAIRTRDQAARGQGETHAALAALYHETGEHERALTHCRQAIDLATRMRDDVVRCDALITATRTELAMGQPEPAVRDAERAVEISTEIGDAVRRAQALVALAESSAVTSGPPAAAAIRAEAMTSLDALPTTTAEELRVRLL
jgi:DNA-binding SARP family transcriptional activator/tetratricopeptide (TPR) repeat protein